MSKYFLIYLSFNISIISNKYSRILKVEANLQNFPNRSAPGLAIKGFQGGYSEIFKHVGSCYFFGFKILNFNIFGGFHSEK